MLVNQLKKLLQKNGSERETYLLSLDRWSDDLPYVTTEDEVASYFESCVEELKDYLGKPKYHGKGPRYSNNILRPKNYFDNFDSSLNCAWWDYLGEEVVVFHTSHDADTLQFVILAISSTS